MYTKVDDIWLYQVVLLAQGGNRNDYFIYYVAINEGSVVISAWHLRGTQRINGSSRPSSNIQMMDMIPSERHWQDGG